MQKSMTFSPSRKEEQQHQSTTEVAGRDRAREKRKDEERERGETGKMQFGSGGSTARDEDARVFFFFFISEPVQDASDYESGLHWTGQSLEGQRIQPGRLWFCGWVVGLRIQAVSRDAVQSRESMMLRV